MKMRADVLLTARGLSESRERAKALIVGGSALLDGRPLKKASELVDDTAVLTVLEPPKYVSRGGQKLEKALFEFSIDLNGLVCADIGASTGGFTDCMLKNGAKRVYAVDVGHDQLAEKLRIDPRVVPLDGVNARDLSSALIGEPLSFVSVDVSFISLKLVIPSILPLLCENARCVFLIKPQFEAGRGSVGKGVVRSIATHERVINEIIAFLSDYPLTPTGLTFSPIAGQDGNIEFLMLCEMNARAAKLSAKSVVLNAHQSLKREV